MSNPPEENYVDVREITLENIPEIARLTGQTEERLLAIYNEARAQGTTAMTLISPLPWQQRGDIASAYANGRCYFQDNADGQSICIVHNQPAPCNGVATDDAS